jgi:hypothetical protein
VRTGIDGFDSSSAEVNHPILTEGTLFGIDVWNGSIGNRTMGRLFERLFGTGVQLQDIIHRICDFNKRIQIQRLEQAHLPGPQGR